jgi:hypothetical protein
LIMHYLLRLTFLYALGALLLAACGGGGGGDSNIPLCQGVICDDDNDCTVDVCNRADGSCINTVQEDDSFCDVGYCQAGECEPIASIFPCTEQGLNDAIAAGGGPHGFSCTGPRLIVTDEEIVIDNDVILDGRDLTVDAGLRHRGFRVTADTTAELWRVKIIRGHWQDFGEDFERGGGGIYNYEGTLGIRNCVITDSEALQECIPGTCADGAGGGILNYGTMTVVNTTVLNNRATGGGLAGEGGGEGGGISNQGTLTLVQSTIDGNSGQLWGGGLHNGRGPTLRGATMSVINSTVTNNVSTPSGANPGKGGGIANEGDLTLISTTVALNTAASGNGIAHGEGTGTPHGKGTVTVTNSLIDDGCEGSITSGGYNIESTGDTCSFNRSTDMVDVSIEDLGLEQLINRGGPTKTHALKPGSVAIDAIPAAACLGLEGEPLETDQRGVGRPQAGACDIGSFELVQL